MLMLERNSARFHKLFPDAGECRTRRSPRAMAAAAAAADATITAASVTPMAASDSTALSESTDEREDE